MIYRKGQLGCSWKEGCLSAEFKVEILLVGGPSVITSVVEVEEGG